MKTRTRAEKALSILQEKSVNALQSAKNTIMQEKMEYEKSNEAIEYYVANWNDTTRPALIAIACEAVTNNADMAPLQTALLLIDAATDIHDDLIDDSTTKSSGLTVYGKFGKETALLIGNAFLVKGFECLYSALDNLPKEKRLQVIETLKNSLFEMINAHILEAQLKTQKWKVTPDTYLQVLNGKAADIEGHMRIGAIYSGASQEQINDLGKYGRNLGLLLAIRADYIDIFEPSELMHKVRYECLPLQILYGLKDRKYNDKIKQILVKAEIDEEDCNELVEIIRKSREFASSKRYLKMLQMEATKALNTLPPSRARDYLRLIIASMLENM